MSDSNSTKSTLAPPPVPVESSSETTEKNDIVVPQAKPDSMSQVAGIPKSVAQERASQAEEPSEPAEIHVISQYYNDSNSERQDEIDYCFRANLERSLQHIAFNESFPNFKPSRR